METVLRRQTPLAQAAAPPSGVVLPFLRPGATGASAGAAPPRPTLSPAEQRQLRTLRALLHGARLRPKLELDTLERLLREPRRLSAEAIASAALRLLLVGAKTDVSLRPLGAETPSEHELWLHRLVAAARAEDHMTLHALIAMRLKPPVRRLALTVARRLAETLDTGPKGEGLAQDASEH